MTPSARQYLLFFICIVSLSLAGILIKFAAGTPAEVYGAYRLTIASTVMGILFLPNIRSIKGQFAWSSLGWSILSGVFLFLHLWSYFVGVSLASIANAMVLFATNPLFTAVATVMIFRKKVGKSLWIADLLAIAGIVCLVYDKLDLSDLNNIGIWSALMSAVLFSGYILAGNQARQKMDNRLFTFTVYFVTAICFWSVCIWNQTPMTGYPNTTYLAILGSVIFPTLLGHALFTYLMKYFDVNILSCGKLTEPFIASFLAFLIFNERIGVSTVWAYLLVGSGILVLFLPQILKKRKT